MNEAFVVVGKGGTIRLPAAWRERYEIREGDTLHLYDLDGVIAVTPRISLVPRLAQEIERMRLEAGVTTEEMLEGLREQRMRTYEETYASET